MKILNLFTSIIFLSLLASCASKNLVKPSDPPLLQNEGYLALAFDTKDKLRTFKIYGESKDTTDIHISSIPYGSSFFMFKVPAGKYCVRKFSTHGLEVTITKGGACVDVEAGKINYPGHIMPRSGTIYFIPNLAKFLDLIKIRYPKICSDYLLRLCQQQFVSEDMDKIRFVMPGISSLREEHRRREAPKTGTRVKGKNNTIDTKNLR
jgi:hypothetical protein